MSSTKPWFEQYTGTKNTSVQGTPNVPTPAGVSPDYMAIVNDLKSRNKAQRVAIATQLKKLGYRIPVTGQVTPEFVTAVWEVGSQKPQWEAINGPMDDQAYLDARVAAVTNTGTGTGTPAGPRTVTSTNISNPTETKSTLAQVMASRLGRYPTEEEIRSYTKALQKAQAKNPTKTTYSADGSAVKTTGGLDSQQFFIDQMAGSDEAKQNRALQAYTYILQSVFGAGN